MLKIYVLKDEKTDSYVVKMKGHCGFADVGQDIICSAATVLCCTLGQVLDENKDKLKEKPKITIHNGKSKFLFSPKEEYKGTLDNVLYTIVTGFKWLEHQYPDNIKIIKD